MTHAARPDNLALMVVSVSANPIQDGANGAFDAREAAGQIRLYALKLFAERGVEGVSVREIAQAAGQKNHAAVTYYFGSKTNLVREIIIEGARAIDIRRNAWLDQVEAKGGPGSCLEVVEGLLRTSLSENPPHWGECYNRFVFLLGLGNRALFQDAVKDKWNSGYQRALDHIRRLKPEVSAKEMNRRLLFMGTAIGGVMATREAELADQSRAHTTWADDATLTAAARAIAAMLDN